MTYWGIVTPGKDSKRSGLPLPSPRRGDDLPIVYSPTQGQPSTHDNLIGGEMTSMNRLCNLSQRRILTVNDIAPVEKQYERYIHIKSKLATLASMEKSEEISEQKETIKSRNILNTFRE
ncbi:hypothetical protein Naga_100170g1 [Nannochloropsis gaditana]|uniref:Uncharacterized protein n=1 Tax=Nannochloropsis gaditana TaxID=72520 RepID=W7UAT6_9STRA|nr:hypothetical protein Naga_100170g1 [Nannochloropsis gaditana]